MSLRMWKSWCMGKLVCNSKRGKTKAIQVFDPSARVRYLAKLLVLGPKEADDPFAAWNDTEQV